MTHTLHRPENYSEPTNAAAAAPAASFSPTMLPFAIVSPGSGPVRRPDRLAPAGNDAYYSSDLRRRQDFPRTGGSISSTMTHSLQPCDFSELLRRPGRHRPSLPPPSPPPPLPPQAPVREPRSAPRAR